MLTARKNQAIELYPAEDAQRHRRNRFMKARMSLLDAASEDAKLVVRRSED